MSYALAILLGYLVGAIPLGLILGKALKGIDIREHGSGKIGATNVLRTLGPKWAAVALVFDLGKGVAAVFIARELTHAPMGEALASFAALAGHNWSLFIKFSGGRGISTGLGALFAMVPIWATGAMGAGVLVIALTRYVSLGSLTGVTFAFISVLVVALTGHGPWAYFGYTAPGSVLVIYQHRDNIQRLLRGTERKLGQKAETASPVSAAAQQR